MPFVMAAIVFGMAAVAQHSSAPPPPTRVVRFTPPKAVSGPARSGTCQRSLVSDRIDAYRCVAAETTYDPCFALERAGHVLCNADPRDAASGIVVTASGPSSSGPRGVNLHAWFFELEDGSTCRPLIAGGGREVDGMVELYTCRFAPPGADAVLGEIDTHAPVWTVQQVSLNKRAPPLSIKQLVSAVVKTAWQ
jgi:hypothetical protein